MNVHDPVRGADETRAEYRARLARSRSDTRRMTRPQGLRNDVPGAETVRAKPDIALMSAPLINLLTRFFRGP